jgi:mono/diheme cytochrome c family protein
MGQLRFATIPMVAVVAFAGFPHHARAADKPATAGQRIYDTECTSCHGAKGKGDGEESAYLTPQPQDFTKGVIQKRSDEFLTTVIAKGGAAKGLSPSMPSFPKLSPADLQSVVAYVRQLGKGAPGKK